MKNLRKQNRNDYTAISLQTRIIDEINAFEHNQHPVHLLVLSLLKEETYEFPFRDTFIQLRAFIQRMINKYGLAPTVSFLTSIHSKKALLDKIYESLSTVNTIMTEDEVVENEDELLHESLLNILLATYILKKDSTTLRHDIKLDDDISDLKIIDILHAWSSYKNTTYGKYQPRRGDLEYLSSITYSFIVDKYHELLYTVGSKALGEFIYKLDSFDDLEYALLNQALLNTTI